MKNESKTLKRLRGCLKGGLQRHCEEPQATKQSQSQQKIRQRLLRGVYPACASAAGTGERNAVESKPVLSLSKGARNDRPGGLLRQPLNHLLFSFPNFTFYILHSSLRCYRHIPRRFPKITIAEV
jgi:hypothetical protein